MESGHTTRPVDPSRKDSPPAQRGFQILGAMLGRALVPQIQEQIVAVLVLAVDVPVIMQLEFQQSQYEILEVLQFLVHRQSAGYSSCDTEKGTRSAKLCRKPSRFHRCRVGWLTTLRSCSDKLHSSMVLDVLVLLQRRPGGASDEFIDKSGIVLRRVWRRIFTAFFRTPFGRRVRTFWGAFDGRQCDGTPGV